MTDIGSGTVKGLLEFLDQLIEKGRMSSGSITPLKSTVRQVFSAVDGKDGWQNVDIRNVNVEDYINRFGNLTIGKYSKDSIVVYKSRLTKALNWYSKFLIEPGWSPKSSIKPTDKSIKTEKKFTKTLSQIIIPTEKNETQSIDMNKTSETSDLIAYPFPLRAGKIVRLYLPIDLKHSEAKRLGNFIESLSIDGNMEG